MERLQRALDLARIERLGSPVARAEPSSAVIARLPVSLPASSPPLAPTPEEQGAAPAPDEFASVARDPAPMGEAAGTATGAAPDSTWRDASSSPFPALLSPVFAPALRARHVVLPEDQGPAAHAYRMLRTQLLQRAAARRASIVGVVSAADGEGKSLTALNLAFSIAADPERNVLLADLDLRRPSIATVLGLTPGRGLETWFSSIAEPQDVDALCMGLVGVPRLVIAPTFAAVPNSSGRLGGNRARRLLDALRRRAAPGLLLLDLPPALLGDDVLAMAPLLDGVLMVVGERQTRRDDLERLQSLLAGVPVLGTVLNASAESERRVY